MGRPKGVTDVSRGTLADSQPKQRKCLGSGRICPECARGQKGVTLSKAETNGHAEM